MIDISIIDGQANASELSIRLEQPGRHVHANSVDIKPVFDTLGKDATGLFFVMKTTNPQAMSKAFSELFEAVSGILTEDDVFLKGVKLTDTIKVKIEKDSIVIVFDSNMMDVTNGVGEIFNIIAHFAESYGLEGMFKISTDISLRDVVGKVSRAKNLSQEEAEKLKDETNLFRFFLKGLSVSLLIGCDKKRKKELS